MTNLTELSNLKINKRVVLLFFSFLVINYLFFNYRILFRQNGYILGDWLINYQGGFAGRAFLGELFYLLSKKFNIYPIHIVYIFSSFCYTLFIFLYYQNIKEYLNNIFILIIVFLPSSLLFNFFDPLTVGRKEILLLLLFSLYFIYIKKYNHNNKFKLLLFFLSIIFMLTHEILFFYLPYFFALSFIFNKESFDNFLNLKRYTLEIFIFLTCSAFLVIILLFPHNTQLICQSLINLGLSKGICFGVISDFSAGRSFSIIIPYFKEKNYFTNYFIYFLISYVPIVAGILNINDRFYKKKFFLISLFCLLFTSPFFLIVNDWGRYFFVHFILQSMLLIMMLRIYPEKKPIIFKNNLIKILLLFFLIIYLGSWHMPHCCNPKIGAGYKDIYDRIKFRLNDNSTETTKYQDKPREYLRKFLKIN